MSSSISSESPPEFESDRVFDTVWIASDLHLLPDGSGVTRPFLSWLRAIPNQGSDPSPASARALVLAGDIFDLFIGSKPIFYQIHHDVFSTLKLLSDADVDLFYIQGNHDFLLDPGIQKVLPKLQVLNSEVVLQGTNARIYVAHGDLVDTEDMGYLRLRRFFRSSFSRLWIGALPGRWIVALGEFLSKRSKARRSAKPEHDVIRPGPARDRLREKYHRFAREKWSQGFQAVVLGHCHDLDELTESGSGSPVYYMNMGYPPVHKSLIVFDGRSGSLQRSPLER